MTKLKTIYLDYAASAAPNPGSIHRLGIEAKERLEKSRAQAAVLLRSKPDEIIFTSGGTESNNLAIQGVVFNFLEGKGNGRKILPHIITTNIEHPSVLETCRLLERRGLAELSVIPVEPNGIVDPRRIKKEIKVHTVLVSVMYVNNEIGTVQPIREIAKEIRHYRKSFIQKGGLIREYPLFHTDAVQAVNYLDLNVEKLGVDFLSVSGAKVKNAGRVGLLYKKRAVPISPVWGGGDQEMGLRPGTPDVNTIGNFVNALIKVQQSKEKESKRLAILREYFMTSLSGSSVLRSMKIIENGDPKNRLPNNINITVPKIPSDLLVIELSARNIMVSSKSACKSSRGEDSYVIQALRPGAEPEIGGLRFSMGEETTKKDIDRTVKALEQILIKLKRWY